MTVAIEHWPLDVPFQITGYTFTSLEVLVVSVSDGVYVGRGEAAGVYYLNDRPAGMIGQVEAVRAAIEAGADRQALRRLLPPGGARNAVDCALWDLEAKQRQRAVWEMVGFEAPRSLLTTYTIGAGPAATMAERALFFADARAIKLKLTGDPADAERVLAVRAARPDVWLGVDANQGFTPGSLADLLPVLLRAEVKLLEQPFRLDQDALLDGLSSPIPIAADESVQGLGDIARLAGRVQVINIKLDKCGGLTEGLAMAAEAKRLGLQVMVGNMLGTGLAMAPAFVLGQLCDVVDLDGPLLLSADRMPGAAYADGRLTCPSELWGSPVGAA